MRILRSKRAFSMIEAATVTCLMTLVVLSTVSMTIGSLRTYDSASTRTYTDADAVMAMQMMVTEVREAKSISLLDAGSRLRVVLPMTTVDGYYDRHEPDTANAIDYYLSDTSGDIGAVGTWLWRSQSGVRRVLKRDLDSVLFEADTARSVKITVIAENWAPSGTKRTELT